MLSDCEVWQPEDTELNQFYDNSSAEPHFVIDFYAYIDERLQFGRFSPQCHRLTDNRTSWSEISFMLSQVGVPHHVQPLMIQKISTDAQEIANDPSNMYLKTIPMVVYLRVPQDRSPEFPVPELRFVFTSKSAIEEILESRVKIEGCEEQCIICLDEIPIGGEAPRMPCSHVFHDSCIVAWLEKSNLCPLCRFEI
ncbi:uncharacterized protein LOC126793889 [Argentina anserina]|uniref:uncharacterized protein LOC126793889 n=1 Tax=Argentina anserina TaxID=57926 RepID=UPI00217634D8|nr:uncharacterized protein LOC126793889 [Potentilla anserina]